MNGSLQEKHLVNRKRLILSLSVLVVSLCVASIAVLAGNTQVPSASGSGQSTGTILTFSAVQHNSGLITGIAQQHDLATGMKTTIDVTCIRVTGTQARIGGMYLRGTQIGGMGDTIVFDVVDNGEGSKAPADEFNTFHLDPCGCSGYFNTATMPSERGNIQVRGGI